MQDTHFISESIRFGWETFKKRPWFLIGTLILTALVTNGPSFVLNGIDPKDESFTVFLVSWVFVVLSFAVEILLIRLWLKAHDSIETLAYRDIFPPRPFWKYIGGQIVVGIAVVVGLLLLIVPGIIAALAFYFTQYLIVERKLWPFEALKESARITKGHRWQLALFSLALFGLNILGALALLIGLLVTIPVSMLAVVHVYRILEHKASEVAPVAAPAA